MTAQGPLRVSVVTDSDSRWKWGASTALALDAERDVTIDALLLDGRSTPTARQLAEVGVTPASMRVVSTHEAGAIIAAERPDVVVAALSGGSVFVLLHVLASRFGGDPSLATRRPVIVSGYVGVVYEKLVEGLLLRVGSDVILANSAADRDRFADALTAVGADPAAIVETSLPYLRHEPYVRDPERPYTVTFATQPSVPRHRDERLALARSLVTHAERHPERHVIVKMRSKPGEHTTHVEEHHYERLLAGLQPPANVEIAYGPMDEVLDRTDLLATVSSTAAIESMQRGIPTAVLTDAGIRETLGNHAFLGAGCYASWADLHAGATPQPNPDWLARNGVGTPERRAALAHRVHELVSGPALPPLRPFYTPDNAPVFVASLLARHALGSDGAPLHRQRSALLTRVLRRAARTAYRQGVQRVAPALRRWGAAA